MSTEHDVRMKTAVPNQLAEEDGEQLQFAENDWSHFSTKHALTLHESFTVAKS